MLQIAQTTMGSLRGTQQVMNLAGLFVQYLLVSGIDNDLKGEFFVCFNTMCVVSICSTFLVALCEFAAHVFC